MTAKTTVFPPAGQTDLDCLPLGIAYAPYQKWRDIYDPAVALKRGTLFFELDLPFAGKGVLPS
ncbi:spore coat associated protein CotJA [Feifania hominis]|uniref:spore coat associated protein CotJA n=1 Tax=Feifania hominis TaxID=2763660 RepID=UPI0020168CDA|nr:spore coat associated protein CotJA [Feifania hominis]